MGVKCLKVSKSIKKKQKKNPLHFHRHILRFINLFYLKIINEEVRLI